MLREGPDAEKFDLWYIDAFAATGDRVGTRKVGGLLEGIPESTVTETLAGSARRALKVNNATMLLWIKVGGVIFFLGVLAFALAFALPQLSIFSLDEMLHAIRKKEKDVAAKQRVTSASAIRPCPADRIRGAIWSRRPAYRRGCTDVPS